MKMRENIYVDEGRFEERVSGGVEGGYSREGGGESRKSECGRGKTRE